MALSDWLGFRRGPSLKQLREMLPSLHSFIDVAVRNGPKGSVCFENTGAKSFTTGVLTGMTSGQTANFVYSNANGRFRFSTTITAVDAKQAVYALPSRIETLEAFSGSRQRNTVRVDTTVPMQWRYAPAGKIESAWQKGFVSDISRTGCLLSADKPIKVGNTLELTIPLLVHHDVITLLAEATRVELIAASKRYTIGLKFLNLRPESDRAILDFINRRQAELRLRGLG